MNKWVGRITFAFLFVAVAAIGGSFIARGVTNLMNENKVEHSNKPDPNRPLIPTGQTNQPVYPDTVFPPTNNRPGSIPNETKPEETFKPNVDVKIDVQPIEWGHVRHNMDRPDDFPSDLKYRDLVKVKTIAPYYKKGLLIDFHDAINDNRFLDRNTLLQAMNNIYVDGYVYFRNACDGVNNIDSGVLIPFNIPDNCTLYQFINNQDYINIQAKNSAGLPVPPSSITVKLTYNPDIWFSDGNPYKFNLRGVVNGPYAVENKQVYTFPVNISGL